MKLTTNLFVLASAYASLSAAQTTTAASDIFTIQPVTSIIPSSLVSILPSLTGTSTSRSLGGSQIEPSSFTTSRRTISDASTDRPTATASGTLTAINPPSVSATATSPIVTNLPSASSASIISSASSVAASATNTPNAAPKVAIGSISMLGALAALAGAILA